MNCHLILFCIFCQYLISGPSHALDYHSDEQDSFEERNFPDLSGREYSNNNKLAVNKGSKEENEDNPQIKVKKLKQEEDDNEQNEGEEDEDDEEYENNGENEEEENQNGNDFQDDPNKPKLRPKEKNTKEPSQYKYEVNAGDMADLFATNKHKYVPNKFTDFGRRFVLKYPINKKRWRGDDEAEARLDQAIKKSLQDNDAADYLVPQKGSPELVLAVAKKSALLEASKPRNRELVKKDSLRSGDFWNGVWKEDVVVPKKVLRTKNRSLEDVLPELETVRVKIMPGSRLHELVSVASRISPRLLYIINNKEK